MPFLPPEALADEQSLAAASRRAVELAREGRSKAGLSLAGQARRHAQSLDTRRGEIEALNAAAIVHLIRGDAICAAAAAIDAIELARREGDREGLGHARVSLGMARLGLGLAGDHCRRLADVVVDSIGCGPLEIRARVALAVALGDHSRFAEAEVELRAALSLSRHHESPTTPARIVSNLANLARKRAVAASDPADVALACRDGIWHAQWARALAIEERNVSVLLDALAIQGSMRVLEGKLQEGVRLLREAVSTAHLYHARTSLPWIQCELGALLLAMGDVPGAREAYCDALEIAMQLTPSRKAQAACYGLAEVEALAGNEMGAHGWRVRANAEAEAHRRAVEHLRFDA